MNALELADFMQSKYDLFPKSEQMQVAEMLRKQDAAIKLSRVALVNTIEDSRAAATKYKITFGVPFRPHEYDALCKTVADAEQALAATEEIANCKMTDTVTWLTEMIREIDEILAADQINSDDELDKYSTYLYKKRQAAHSPRAVV